MKRVLITSTSLHDTSGAHHELLQEEAWEVEWARGPLSEDALLKLVGDFDGIICGDDVYTKAVLEKALPRLKFLSKYGIGVDKIDVAAATDLALPLFFTPGVNHTTVSEHVFSLILALHRNLYSCLEASKRGEWKRVTGNEIMGKKLGIVGLGRIGREVAMRAKVFGMDLYGFGNYWPEAFAEEYEVKRCESFDAMLPEVDVLTLHCNLTEATHDMINAATLSKMKDGAIIINCARGEIVKTSDMVDALNSGKIRGYGTDVLDQEPPPSDHPLLLHDACIVTPHIGSRTYESVVRQATMAIMNLKLAFEGKEPLAQVNELPIVS